MEFSVSDLIRFVTSVRMTGCPRSSCVNLEVFQNLLALGGVFFGR